MPIQGLGHVSFRLWLTEVRGWEMTLFQSQIKNRDLFEEIFDFPCMLLTTLDPFPLLLNNLQHHRKITWYLSTAGMKLFILLFLQC